jgi:surface polysaccharide O-acyltransferase-like enzyme
LWYLLATMWSAVILFFFVRIGKLNLLLIGSFLLNLAGLFGQSYSIIIEFPLSITRDALFYGLFYLTLGFWFATHTQEIQRRIRHIPRSAYLILLCVFSLAQMLERMLLFDPEHLRSNENYYISTIPLVICLFLFVLTHKSLGKGTFIAKVGANTIGIYVIHLFFMDAARKLIAYFGYEAVYETFIWHLFFTPFVMAVSYIGYRALQKAKQGLMLNRAEVSLSRK